MLGIHKSFAEGSESLEVRDADRDVELIAAVADRDLKAFEELYRAYYPKLGRFLSNILRRPHLVEEVLNDAMMVVWRQPERYNGKSKVSTWIFAIAYRQALKALSRSDEPVEDKGAEARPCGDAGPEQQLSRRQGQALLSRAIGELSPEQRAVVDLTYFQEFGYRDIAELLGCPVDTVKTRMFHARRRLKTKLSGELADWL
jgi:RNA polymerase sigma factor (sigma-70 family)